MAEGISQLKAESYLGVLRGLTASTAYNAADSYHIGLLTDLPPDTGETAGIELTTAASGYTRYEIPIEAATSSWSTPSLRQMYNLNKIEFGPALINWPKVVAVAIYPDATSTLADAFFHLDQGFSVIANDYLKFAPGQLVLTADKDKARKSDDLANRQLRIMHNEPYSLRNNDVWIGLGTEVPNANGDITELTPENAPGYARIPYGAIAANWTDPTGLREIKNALEIEFGDALANWPVVKSFGLFENAATKAEDPNPIYCGPLQKTATIFKYGNLILAAEAIVIKE